VKPSQLYCSSQHPELAEVIACAHRNNWSILPCGSGSNHLGWAGVRCRAGCEYGTPQLGKHAVGDLTVTEAGTKFADLQAILAKLGSRLDPAAPEAATIEALSPQLLALCGNAGGVRDQLLGTPLSESGWTNCRWGRVVKNVAGYDLMLFTGSYGTLGFSLLLRFALSTA